MISMNESIRSLPLTLRNVTSRDYQNYTCIGRDNNVKDFISASVILSKWNILMLLTKGSYIAN